MKNYKQYFAIMQQNEFELKLKPSELMVYLAIKSFLANGKQSLSLSSRDIASRTSLSQPEILKVTSKLIKKGLIKIIGKEGRRGGMCSIYQLITPLITKSNQVIYPLITKTKSSDNPGQSSDNPGQSSDNSLGTNLQQSNKVINKYTHFKNNLLKPLSEEKLYSISLKLNIHVRHVRQMQETILEKQANHELKKPYKNMERIIINWLRGSISRKYLSEMDEAEKLDNECEEPARVARFREQIKKWEGKAHAN